MYVYYFGCFFLKKNNNIFVFPTTPVDRVMRLYLPKSNSQCGVRYRELSPVSKCGKRQKNKNKWRTTKNERRVRPVVFKILSRTFIIIYFGYRRGTTCVIYHGNAKSLRASEFNFRRTLLHVDKTPPAGSERPTPPPTVQGG